LIIVVLAGLIFWGLSRSPKNDLLKEVPNLPAGEWSRVITTKEAEPGYKVLTNKFDGYEITVPSEWTTPELATSGEYGAAYNNLGLNIFVVGDIKDAELIFPTSARFVEVETPSGKAYKTTNKILGEDTFQNKEIISLPIENSLSVGYILLAKEKVYVILCSAVGDNFEKLVSLCEKQILTFKILK